MICANCDQPFREGDEVEMQMLGNIVNGQFRQTEEERMVHEECPE